MNSALQKARLALCAAGKKCANFADHWPFALSAAVAGLAYFGWNSAKTLQTASELGTYISGVTSAIAIIWIVAGFRNQTRELTLQRQELQLQRLAAERQAKELTNSAKLGSLGQIRSLLEDAEKCVRDSPLKIQGVTDIQRVYFDGMRHWHPIENSNVASEVSAAYSKWIPVEAVARNYVRYVASALKIYIEHHCPQAVVDHSKDPEEFLTIYESWGRNAPFISHHIGVASLMAQFLWTMSPGLERLRLAWMVASAKSLGMQIMKEQAMVELRDKVLNRSKTLPKICTPWPLGN